MTPIPATAAVRVRRAELSDLNDLVTLEEQSFASDRLSRAQFRRHLDSESALVLVASANHRRFLGTAVVFSDDGEIAMVFMSQRPLDQVSDWSVVLTEKRQRVRV